MTTSNNPNKTIDGITPVQQLTVFDGDRTLFDFGDQYMGTSKNWKPARQAFR